MNISVIVLTLTLTCTPLLPVPPVGHNGHGPAVEAQVPLTGSGAGDGAGAETCWRGHLCHITELTLSSNKMVHFYRHVDLGFYCAMVGTGDQCQLWLTV